MPVVEIFINNVRCQLVNTTPIDLDELKQHCIELAVMTPGNQIRLHVDGVELLQIVAR